MRIIVDRDACESNGLCVGLVPEVFRLGDDDVLQLLNENPPESLRAQLDLAVRACPKAALRVDT